jgi:hypothetical protein
MPAYQYRLADGGGTYITDARTPEDAQAELCAHYLRPVVVYAVAGRDRLQDRKPCAEIKTINCV